MENKKITPMMKQYLEVKEKNPGKIVFFRMGDFFEMFGPDALEAAEILQIQLTSRSKDKDAWPMCGVPAHAYEHYLNKLVQAGKKVVICDQVEDAALAKGLVRREVIETITPGLSYHEALLNPSQSNYIAGVYYNTYSSQIGLVFAEFSRGLVEHSQAPDFAMAEELLIRQNPRELVLLSEDNAQGNFFFKQLEQLKVGRKIAAFPERARPADFPIQGLVEKAQLLFPAAVALPVETCAALGFLAAYIERQTQADLGRLEVLKPMGGPGKMALDSGTLRNLEIFQSIGGEEHLGLFHFFNHCQTPMGSRLLREWFLNPLTDVGLIEERQNFISAAFAVRTDWSEIGQLLAKVGDLERLAQRFNLPNVGLAQLVRLRTSLEALPPLIKLLESFPVERAQQLIPQIESSPELLQLLQKNLKTEPALKVKEGGYINNGISVRFDELFELRSNAKVLLAKIEAEERQKSGIQGLKIGFNRVFGYYFEISQANKKEIPAHFIRKQTLVNTERYTTPALTELESEILQAEERMNALEEAEFLKLVLVAGEYSEKLKQVAGALAEFDLVINLAKIAEQKRFVRPEFVRSGQRLLELKGGRHPIMESLKRDYPFIANDCIFKAGEQNTILITGPNMGGKSTFIRQTALILFLAQIGSFVPAESLRTCLFDRIFTRVGAMDNLSEGLSTFMVEMREATLIAREATGQSLVVIDELGRGTSTFDGIGIAWGLVEHLNNQGAFTLFATHYHELTKLSTHHMTIKNFHVAVSEAGADLVFLYKILPGVLHKSYGIQVAALAGMPKTVLDRANQIQSQFSRGEDFLIDEPKPKNYNLFNFDTEKSSSMNGLARKLNTVPLGKEARSPKNMAEEAKLREVSQAIQEFQIDSATPLECMQTLVQLQKKLKEL